MNEHLIIYIDLLGTRDALKSSSEAQKDALVRLLSYVASLRGDFNITPGADEGLTTTHIRPTVSTFSDHIVISYPVDELRKVNERDGLGLGLALTQEGIISYLAPWACSSAAARRSALSTTRTESS